VGVIFYPQIYADNYRRFTQKKMIKKSAGRNLPADIRRLIPQIHAEKNHKKISGKKFIRRYTQINTADLRRKKS
jgi:hypothetical protein